MHALTTTNPRWNESMFVSYVEYLLFRGKNKLYMQLISNKYRYIVINVNRSVCINTLSQYTKASSSHFTNKESVISSISRLKIKSRSYWWWSCMIRQKHHYAKYVVINNTCQRWQGTSWLKASIKDLINLPTRSNLPSKTSSSNQRSGFHLLADILGLKVGR